MMDGRKRARSFVDAPDRGGVWYLAAVAVLPGGSGSKNIKKNKHQLKKKRSSSL